METKSRIKSNSGITLELVVPKGEKHQLNVEKPRLNVIFVHGLTGDPKKTWSHQDNENNFWPAWLAEDIPGVAVYSLGYPANMTKWESGWPLRDTAYGAQEIIDTQLISTNSNPIIFICHSLGGLVVKKMIVDASISATSGSKPNHFLERVSGVVFLATPHRGSVWADLPIFFKRFLSDASNQLNMGSMYLDDLDYQYRRVVCKTNPEIRHKVYFEEISPFSRKISVLTRLFMNELIVTRDSADPSLCDVLPIKAVGKDHVQICKPKYSNDQIYVGVKDFVGSLVPLKPSDDAWWVQKAAANVSLTEQEIFYAFDALMNKNDLRDKVIFSIKSKQENEEFKAKLENSSSVTGEYKIYYFTSVPSGLSKELYHDKIEKVTIVSVD